MCQALGNTEESIAFFRRSLPVEDQLIREDPLSVMYRRQAAISNRSLSLILLRVGSFPEARQRSDRSAGLFGQLAAADPANMEAQEALADSQFSQGYVLQKENDLAGARKYYEASNLTYHRELANHPATIPAGLRTVYQLMADLGISKRDAPLAIRNAREELALDDRLLAANAHNASAERNQGVAYGQIGQAHEVLAGRPAQSRDEQNREWREALAWHQKALDLWVSAQEGKSVDSLVRHQTR